MTDMPQRFVARTHSTSLYPLVLFEVRWRFLTITVSERLGIWWNLGIKLFLDWVLWRLLSITCSGFVDFTDLSLIRWLQSLILDLWPEVTYSKFVDSLINVVFEESWLLMIVFIALFRMLRLVCDKRRNSSMALGTRLAKTGQLLLRAFLGSGFFWGSILCFLSPETVASHNFLLPASCLLYDSYLCLLTLSLSSLCSAFPGLSALCFLLPFMMAFSVSSVDSFLLASFHSFQSGFAGLSALHFLLPFQVASSNRATSSQCFLFWMLLPTVDSHLIAFYFGGFFRSNTFSFWFLSQWLLPRVSSLLSPSFTGDTIRSPSSHSVSYFSFGLLLLIPCFIWQRVTGSFGLLLSISCFTWRCVSLIINLLLLTYDRSYAGRAHRHRSARCRVRLKMSC